MYGYTATTCGRREAQDRDAIKKPRKLFNATLIKALLLIRSCGTVIAEPEAFRWFADSLLAGPETHLPTVSPFTVKSLRDILRNKV